MAKGAALFLGVLMLSLLGLTQESGIEPVEPLPSVAEAEAHFAALSKKLQTFKTYRADFRQEVTTASFPRPRIESGTLTAMNPGRLRWDYEKPEEKLALSDGEYTWFYMPLDRVVYKQPVPEHAADVPTLVLAGRGSLTELFTILVLPREGEHLRLELLARKQVEMPWSRLILTMDPKAVEVVQVDLYEDTGVHTMYTFANTRWDEPVDADHFRFTPPKGVRVVTSEAEQAP